MLITVNNFVKLVVILYIQVKKGSEKMKIIRAILLEADIILVVVFPRAELLMILQILMKIRGHRQANPRQLQTHPTLRLTAGNQEILLTINIE